MVNLDLLLAMKLVAFRSARKSDVADCRNIVAALKSQGENVNSEYIVRIIKKYYKNTDILSKEAKIFAGLEKI